MLVFLLLSVAMAGVATGVVTSGTFNIDLELKKQDGEQLAIITVDEPGGFDDTLYSQIVCIENWRDNKRATEGDIGLGIALDHGATGAAFTGTASVVLVS